MIPYHTYFIHKKRSGENRFTCLADDRPDELHELVRSMHGMFDAMPNDWIYSVIEDAFDALENEAIAFDYMTWETDFGYKLREWALEPYADECCIEAEANGDVASPPGLVNVLMAGQRLAKDRVYYCVNEFLQSKRGGTNG